MKEENQNSIIYQEQVVGHDKFGNLTYEKIKIVTTETRLMVFDSKDNVIGEAGVLRKKDFDFDALLKIARKPSGKTIIAA